MLRLSDASILKLIVLRSEVCSDWPVIRCIVIGRIPQCEMEMLRPLPYCDAVSRRDDTKTIKPINNEAFVSVQCGHKY